MLGIVTLGQTLASLVGLSVLPLAPLLQAEFEISRAQVGLLISALYLGAFFSSLPSGWLTDAIGSRTMLVASQAVIAAGIVLLSRAAGFTQAVAVMPLVGLGYGGINPMSSKAVMLWFPGRIRGTAMSVKQTGFALGGALGALTLPALALGLGWRSALVLAGVLIVGSAILGGWLFREAPAAPGQTSSRLGLRSMYGKLVHDRDLMIVVGTGVIFAAIQLVVSGYLVLFLAEVVQLPIVAAGAMLSIAQVSGAVGRIGWGTASDHLTGGRRRPVLLALGIAATAVAMLVSLLGRDAPTVFVIACAALLGVTAIGWNGVFATLVGELAGAGSVAGATGLSTAANFLGVILGPPLFGLAVDLSGSYALAWRLVALIGFLNAALLLLVRERRA